MKNRNLRLNQSPSLGEEDAEKIHHNRIRDLQSANESLKRNVEELRSKLGDVSIRSSGVGTVIQSSRDSSSSRTSIATKQEGMSSRSKSNSRSMKSPVNQFDSQIQKLKAQKVKLQCKIKLDSMQFRLTKASLEKETHQLKKELRRSEFEKNVLSALNTRQKLILQLKNTQALTALRRLKSVPRSKKISSNKNNGQPKGASSKIQESSNEVGILMKLNKIRSDYERQMKEIAEEVKRFSVEASVLKAEFEGEQNSGFESCDSVINHTPMDSELKELKEEFNKLSTLVSQMEMTKSQLSETNNVKVIEEPAGYSVSSKDTDDQSSLEPSQLNISEETVCNSNDQSNLDSSPPETYEETDLELSQPETSEKTLCKKEQIKAEVCCSCTKKSSCKTKNCKCRANGSGCGDSCGCLVSKCSNREENASRTDKAMQAVDGKKVVDDKEAKKQPLRDIGNIREAEKVGKQRKMQKPVAKK